MEVFSLAILAALVGKVVTVLKAVGKDWNMVGTQVAVWAVGIAVVALGAHTSWAGTIVIQNIGLGDMNAADLVFLGLGLGAGISQVYDFKKARDNTDTASEPPLLAGVRRRPHVIHTQPPTSPS